MVDVKRGFVAGALAALLLLVADHEDVRAVTLVAPDGQVAQPYQQWADRSMIATPNVAITVHPEPCPGLGHGVKPSASACVLPWMPNDLWIAPGLDARALMHELGHSFDLALFADEDRRAFAALIGLPYHGLAGVCSALYCIDGFWRRGPDRPSEWFAEAYTHCATNPQRFPDEGMFGYGYMPTQRKHQRACLFIRDVATRTPGAATSPSATVPSCSRLRRGLARAQQAHHTRHARSIQRRYLACLRQPVPLV